MSAPGNDNGALSGQMDQPSGLWACAEGRWTWRMTTDGGGGRRQTAVADQDGGQGRRWPTTNSH